MPEFANETVCATCGVALFRHWNGAGTESRWLDANQRNVGVEGGREGIDDVYAWLDWLRDNCITEYSLFSVRVSMGATLLPWQHRHKPKPVHVIYSAGEDLPWCCGEPAWLIRAGWRCRVNARHRP